MAAPARIITLNLGMQTLGMAEFRPTSNGGLMLNQLRLTELLADPAAEGSRVAQLQIAVQEMVSALKIKAGRVNYAIPAQSVFTRFVKLPSVDPDKVDQIIAFEAQQNVPFPIEEVVWDYQLVGGAQSDKIEVVLVAIKSDLLEDLSNSVEGAGLSTNVVDVGPMALYNCFRYNYSDVSGCSLLIDIGARTTNLIFVEPNKVFTRSIPIGGTTITAAIAKEFNEPFGASEERKRQIGFVSLGSAYAEPPDPDQARVSKMIRNTMTRLHSEITRSISFYRSQQGGSPPQRIYLCGGSAGMPYMREFFNEKIQQPVEFFNPLRNVAVGKNVSLEEAGRGAHVLGELVGLALRSVTNCPMELSLRPVSVERSQKLAKKRPFLVLAGVCLLLCLAGWWLYYLRAAAVESQVIADLEPRVNMLKGVETRMNAVRKEIQNTQTLVAPLVGALQERSYWIGVIDEFNKRLPQQYIWVTLFEPVRFEGENVVSVAPAAPPGDGSVAIATAPPPSEAPTPAGTGAKGVATAPKYGVRLRGLYLDNPQQAAVVDQFQKNLSESPLVANVTIPPGGRATPTGTEWAYDYEFLVELKQGISPQ